MPLQNAEDAIKILLIASVRDFRRQRTKNTRMIAWSRIHALSEALAHVTGETPTKVLNDVYEVVGRHREAGE